MLSGNSEGELCACVVNTAAAVRQSARKTSRPSKYVEFDAWTPRKKKMKQALDEPTVEQATVASEILQYEVDDQSVEQTTVTDEIPQDEADEPTVEQATVASEILQYEVVQQLPVGSEIQPIETDEATLESICQADDGSYIISAECLDRLTPGNMLQIDLDVNGNVVSSFICSPINDESSEGAVQCARRAREGERHISAGPAAEHSYSLETAPNEDTVASGIEHRKSRKRMRSETTWKRNKSKIAKQGGLAYVSSSGKEVSAKHPCITGWLCKKKCHRLCSSKLNEDQRQTLFDSYYSLADENQKNTYLFGCIKPVTPKVKLLHAKKHRKMSFAYFVTVDGQSISVCKTAFSRLHQITNSKIDYILSQHLAGRSTAEPSKKDDTESGVMQLVQKEFKESWSISACILLKYHITPGRRILTGSIYLPR